MLPEVGSTIVPPGPQATVLLGSLDHREADAVLHRATGIQVLELREQLTRHVTPEALEADDRSAADELEHGGKLAARHRAGSLLLDGRTPDPTSPLACRP